MLIETAIAVVLLAVGWGLIFQDEEAEEAERFDNGEFYGDERI